MDRRDRRWDFDVAATLLAAALLSACGGSPGVEEAEEPLRQWRLKGPASYVYVGNAYTRNAAGFYDTDQFDGDEWRVVVDSQQVTSVSLQANGRPLADPALTMEGLLQAVVAYMKRRDPHDEDYEMSIDDRWGYLKHFKHIGQDVATYFDASCFEASTSDDACPLITVDEQECSQAPIAVSPEFLNDVIFNTPTRCNRLEDFTRIRGKELMCCHPRF